MGRFHVIDAVVLGVYLVGTTVLGIWAGRKAKASIAQYFMPRRFGKTMLLFYSFGTGQARRVALFTNEPFPSDGSLSISPDRRWALFDAYQSAGGRDIILVENFR